MNRDCNGDYWPVLNLYRCLLDGSFLRTYELPIECENCNRKIVATVHEKTEMRTVHQVNHPTFGWLSIPENLDGPVY